MKEVNCHELLSFIILIIIASRNNSTRALTVCSKSQELLGQMFTTCKVHKVHKLQLAI